MKQPAVYLIGAGPGDPGLITRARARVPARAPTSSSTTTSCRRGCCGTRGAGAELHRRRQRRAAARWRRRRSATCSPTRRAKASVVARLKWGDPFVFDRGGEEALFLHEQGVAVRGGARRSGRHRRRPPMPACRSPTRAAATPSRSSAATRTRAARRPTSTGPAWRGSTAPSSATPARSSCRAILDALLAHGWPADDDGRDRLQRHARRTRRRSQGTLAELLDAVREQPAARAGDPRRRARRRLPRAPALVRRAAAVRHAACWSRGRASRRPSWSSGWQRSAPKPSRRR